MVNINIKNVQLMLAEVDGKILSEECWFLKQHVRLHFQWLKL